MNDTMDLPILDRPAAARSALPPRAAPSRYACTLAVAPAQPGLHRAPPQPTREEKEQELRMWLIVRTDIDIPRPKLSAQAGHGFCRALWQAMTMRPDVAAEYMERSGEAKITVAAKNLAALQRAHQEAVAAGLPSAIVIDAGRTVFKEPTCTVVGIGPCLRAELPRFVQKLQFLKH